MRIYRLIVFAVLLFSAISAETAPANLPLTPAQGDGAPRITPAELRALVQRGRAIIVDVRSLEAYKEKHIKGARSMPVDEVEARVNELPRGKMIATYCA